MAPVARRDGSARTREHRLELGFSRRVTPFAHEIAEPHRVVGVRAAALAPEQDLAADHRFELAADHARRDADRRLGVVAPLEMTRAFFLVPVRADDRLPRRQRDAVGLLHVAAQVVQAFQTDAGFDAVHFEQRGRFLERDAAAAIADADHRASIQLAPASTAAIAFAVATPRSLWCCT
jgi:hypothetical protein